MSSAPLLSATKLSKSFGNKPLFTDITLTISEGERTALIGPNGSGKSTLLRMMAGLEDADSGTIRNRGGLRYAYVPQEDSFDENLTITETLKLPLIRTGISDHEIAKRIDVLCGRALFPDKNARVAVLSGGWRKRLAIIRGMIVDPDLLLLDEPTNHLDIPGILWLESILSRANYALLFVSHDRYFIENLAKRVIEINKKYPSGFYAQNGAYADFLEGREAYTDALHQQRDALANRTRREVEWLRQGAKARTTKSKYRSEQAHLLVDQLKKFNLEEKRVSLEFSPSNRKSRDLIKLDRVGKSFGNKTLFKDISLTLSPGVRLGVVGHNGSGKTTFLKTLLGEIKPDSGEVILAKNLRLAFFDQARKQIDLSQTLKQALCTDGDSVVFKGKQIHVAGWAERFLFTRDHLALPVSALSGGERARVLLARLMLEERDVLIFDEPTNDLDIRTLEILEESFCEYPGAIVLVSHDRYILERVATTVLGVGANGGIFGDYFQWEDAARNLLTTEVVKVSTLSSEEKRELDGIEKQILKAERALEKTQQDANSDAVLADPKALKECCEKLAQQQQVVEDLYNRWEELEDKRKQVRER